MKLLKWGLCLAALAPVVALADDPPPPQGKWTGKGQAGVVASQGNTSSKSANAAIDAALLEGSWKHALHLGGLYGQSAGITAAERWDVLWQSNYDINKNLFTFGSVRYAHDMFSGFQYQATASAGMGYKFLDTDSTKLSAQLGAGYRSLRPEDLVKNASGAVIERIPLERQGEAVFTAGVDFWKALTGTTALSNKFLVESGSSNTFFTDALALTVKMSDRLALSVGYTLQENTKPPAGLKKIDTTETVNLVFAL